MPSSGSGGRSSRSTSRTRPPASRSGRSTYLHDIALESIVGRGPAGYTVALESIARRVAAGELPR